MRFFRAGTLSLLALAACAQGQAPAGSPPCEGAACEDPIPDVGGERDAEPEPEPEPDADTQPDPEPTDTPEPDAEPDPEPDVEEMGGVFGVPCDSNDDCIADVCIDTRAEGRICTDFCLDDDQCPEGFYCGTYINVDAVSVCLELDASLCDPCTQDRQCGGASDLCADLIDGSFCGRSCEPPRPDCPEGFDCVIVRDDDDAVVSRQCLPSERLCTDCLDADEDGYGTGGACLGPDCDDNDPERFPGASEICDGIDNNCDGNTDETTDLRDDPNNCGDCGRVCTATNATPLCSDGTCALGPCEEGFVDLNGDPEDGCEFACEPTSDIDRPDPNFIDANCDGIDGDIDGAIFVQQDSGDDLNPGTPSAPMQTIAAAIQVARQQGKVVYVGTSRTPYPGPINLLGGVDLYGGFNFDQNLARNTSAATRIEGGTRTVVADGVSLPTVFMGFEVRAADAAETGQSSYAVWVRDSDGLQLLNNTLTSGAGASGLAGSGGNDGSTGRPGLSGEEGCEEICFIDACNPSGGNPGSGPVCLDNRAAGNGGGGGRGGFEAQSGRNGTGGFGAEGGDGGIGGSDGVDGTSGGLGGPGLDGANGPGGDGGQIDSRGLWISNSGSEGGDGSHGSGGGGGGGGGGGVVNCLLHRADGGGGGGGGGSGGCGGTGATGGTGGGGSFGVFLVSSSPRIEGNLIRAGLGGRGGAGGEAGSGGAGGEGAPGGLHEDESGDGGAGAPGGAGGRGGHGGGGSGGPSIGIYRGPGSAPVIGPNDIAVAGPGDGGASVGNPGSEGLTGPIR